VDDIDRAQQREEQDRELALAVARRQTVLPATGECHWCAASVAGEAHFCDIDCRAISSATSPRAEGRGCTNDHPYSGQIR